MRNIFNLFYIACLLLAGVTNVAAAVSDPPETLPQSPSQEASTVKSVFCGVYTNTVNITNFSGQGTSKITSVSGDEMIYINNGLNGWTYANLSSSLNIDDYETLHMDVYVVSGAFDLKVSFASGSTTFTLPKLQEGWNSVNIKLSDYKSLTTPPDFKNVTQIGFINNSGYARTIYVDNIYAYGSSDPGGPGEPEDPELPANPAPTPTQAADNVKSIFSDAYTNLTEITSFSGTAEGKGTIFTAYTNDQLIKLTGALNHWAQINFSPVNLANMETFHADIFVVRASGTIELKIKFNEGKEVSRTLNPGWNSLDIPMADFKDKDGVMFTGVNKIDMIRTGGYPQNVYIDNIYAYGKTGEEPEPSDPYAPTVSADIPQHPAEDVISIFSDAYTNAVEISLNNAGNPPAEMKIITPFTDDNMLRFTSMNWVITKFETIDMSESDYIHFDIWVTESNPRLHLGLGNWSKIEYSDVQTLKPGWNSIDIPLDVYRNKSVDLSDVIVFRMYSASGFAIARLYFDNVYAYKGVPAGNKVPTYEILSAPEPIMAKTTVKSLFTEKYLNLSEIENVYSEPENQYEIVYLREINMVMDSVVRMRTLDKAAIKTLTALNYSDMDSIHFNIYHDKKKGGDASLQIGFKSSTGDIEVYSETVPQLKEDAWSYVNISVQKLKDAGLDCSKINQIIFKGSGNVYIDNIFAFRGKYALGLGEEGKVSMDWDEASRDDVLPDRNQAFLGLNLASASGGETPGVIGQNYTYPSFDDLYYFKSKGVRLFRFPFRWQRVQHEVNGTLDLDDPKSDVAEIKKVIAEAERLGMYVMLDMHDYCRRKVNGTTYKFGESEHLTKEHFADVWTKLAAEFKDFTNIWGYDIMNEPYGLSPGVWLQAAQAAINGIRSVDTKTPIVVEGESYAAASTWPTTGGHLINLTDPNDNLIYSAHCYFDKDKSGLYVLGEYDKEVSSPTQHIDRLAPYVNWLKEHNKQGILGEFGVPRNDVRWLNMLDEVLAYLKENKVSATYWVGGNGYAADHVSIQPLESYTVERAQIRVLGKYFANFGSSGTSIADPVSMDLNISQNVSFDGVTINSEAGINVIRIVNLSGRLVKTVNVNNTRADIDLSEMPTGIYILQILCKDGKTVTGKIAKM